MRDPKSTPVWIAVAFAVVASFGVAVLIRGAKNVQEQEKAGASRSEPPPLPTLEPRR